MEDWLKCQISPLVKYRQKLFMVKTRIIHDRCQNFYSTCIEHYSLGQKYQGEFHLLSGSVVTFTSGLLGTPSPILV